MLELILPADEYSNEYWQEICESASFAFSLSNIEREYEYDKGVVAPSIRTRFEADYNLADGISAFRMLAR
jgi:hypothetical protein